MIKKNPLNITPINIQKYFHITNLLTQTKLNKFPKISNLKYNKK
jgi:hypothetical protein